MPPFSRSCGRNEYGPPAQHVPNYNRSARPPPSQLSKGRWRVRREPIGTSTARTSAASAEAAVERRLRKRDAGVMMKFLSTTRTSAATVSNNAPIIRESDSIFVINVSLRQLPESMFQFSMRFTAEVRIPVGCIAAALERACG